MTFSNNFDFESAYKVAGHGGIAWRAFGFAFETVEVPYENEIYFDPDLHEGMGIYEEDCITNANGDKYFVETLYDFEDIEDYNRVRMHMVGDDKEWIFDVSDLTPLSEDDYCPSCGQIGCRWH